VSTAFPPERTGLVTDAVAWGAAPPTTLTRVVATLVIEEVQKRVAT
jgi:hypothetical protein